MLLSMSETPATFLTVGIDGGAATGKSSTARRVAAWYGLLHVDTGSHYRALAARLLAKGITPDSEAVVRAELPRLQLSSHIEAGSAHIAIDGEVPPDESLRTEKVNAHVSQFAAMPCIREALKGYQREQRTVARDTGFAGLIMEGRDIGSVIFPDADLLFFLEADAATRAARRAAEGLADSISERDKIDTTRKTAPLTCPANALRINTGAHTLEAVVALIGNYVEARGLKPVSHEPA